MAIYTTITSSPATTTLIHKGGTQGGGIKEIIIANFSDNAADAVVNLYLNDGSATDIYLFKNVAIPKGATLLLDNNLSFDTSRFSLKMYSTGTAPALSVIIK
jgi:hypothetical protein